MFCSQFKTLSPPQTLRSNSHTSFTMAIAPNTTKSAPIKRSSGKGKSKEPSDKPKRPLSAYNLFFRHARAEILKEAAQPTYKPRRSHGKIGFAALARSVAEKWKSLEKDEKKIFEGKAVEEKERYERELEVWNQKRVEKINSFYQQEQQNKMAEVTSTPMLPFASTFFAPLETTSSMPSMPSMPIRNVSFSDVSSCGSVFDERQQATFSHQNTSHALDEALQLCRNSQFNFVDCTPLPSNTNSSLDTLMSGFDDECFNILSALK